MDCREAEVRLVHALDGETSPAVDEHLEQCEACRLFYAELLADRDALHVLGSEDVPEEAVQQLHERVMQRIPRRRRGWWWIPAAAAAMFALAMVWPREHVVAPPAVVAAVAKPPRIAWLRSTPQPPPQPAPKPVIRKRAAEQPLWVKLETPDPNVIIYWMVEPKGEME